MTVQPKITGSSAYYLVIGNDGSLILYDSLGVEAKVFADYMQGLNSQVFQFMDEVSGLKPSSS